MLGAPRVGKQGGGMQVHRGCGGRDDGDDEFVHVVGGDGGDDEPAMGGVVVGEVGDGEVLGVEPGGRGEQEFGAGRVAGASAGGVVGAGPGQQRAGREAVGGAVRGGRRGGTDGVRGLRRGVVEAFVVAGVSAVGVGVAAGLSVGVGAGVADQAGASADVLRAVVAAGSEHEKRCGHGVISRNGAKKG